MDFKKLQKSAGKMGLDDIQLVTKKEEELQIRVYNGMVDQNETSSVTCCIVTGLLNGQKTSYTVEDPDMDEEAVSAALYEIASHMNSDETSEIFPGSESYPVIETETPDYVSVPLSEKIAMLKRIEKVIREKEPRVEHIQGLIYSEGGEAVSIQNSKGLDIAKANGACTVLIHLVASDGVQPKVGHSLSVKRSLAEMNLEEMADEAINMAVSKFGASTMESGEYDVIIENDAMISLLSSFSGMFGGEMHLKKISPVLGKLGEKIFSDKITIYDMPLKEDAVTREPFDDEGVACSNKTIVEKGVFRQMMHNLKTAKAFGVTPTGNSFGGGIHGCNFFIEAGERDKEALISSMEKGVLLTGFDGIHAGLNPISGDMSLSTSGFYIENGKIVRPVSLIIMAANFMTMMNEVVEVGSDLKISSNGIGSPSIRFEKVSISGS